MRKTITKLNALDMAIILLLFEASTLLVKNLIAGRVFGTRAEALLTGLAGTIIALAVWHALKQKVRGSFGTLTKISVVRASIANAAFLLVLWTLLELLPDLGSAVLGFVSVALALVLLVALYNVQPLKLRVKISNKTYSITSVAPVQTALIAGVYEAIILPVMNYLFTTLPFPQVLTDALAGAGAGLVGGLVGTLIYNFLPQTIKPWVELE